MLIYWSLFAFFAVGAMAGPQNLRIQRRFSPLMVLGMLAVMLIIGLRFEVGADWKNYEFIYSYAGYDDFWDQMKIGDPAYQTINWASQQLGADIWLVNVVCAAIFTWGLARFARVQPDPWLAVVIAVPYLIIVVAMGYTRQAVALGILLAGLAAFKQGSSTLRFAVYVAAAALFHKTAVVALSLVIFAGKRNRALNVVAGIALSVLFYDLFLSSSVENFVRNYVQQEYNSQGAAIRVAMNLVPAALLLMFPRKLGFTPDELRVWQAFSLAAIVMLVLLIVSPSSTAVDRMALYIMPLQIAVMSRAPLLFGGRRGGKLAIIAYALAIQFIWLNFAAHAEYWLPYQFYPFAA